MEIARISTEYENALAKKRELTERLRHLEGTDPHNLRELWMTRDQIAYWQGKAEGLKFAL